MTKRACEFVQPLTFRALSGSHVVVDDYAPDNPDPDRAYHVFSDSRSAGCRARDGEYHREVANGVADDFLSSTYLRCTAPVLIAPANEHNDVGTSGDATQLTAASS
jgi:phosphopantothenoylcysteine decarboxylase/phosphopantothenate--cysteine ligase